MTQTRVSLEGRFPGKRVRRNQGQTGVACSGDCPTAMRTAEEQALWHAVSGGTQEAQEQVLNRGKSGSDWNFRGHDGDHDQEVGDAQAPPLLPSQESRSMSSYVGIIVASPAVDLLQRSVLRMFYP
jgi:hypothetical protein